MAMKSSFVHLSLPNFNGLSTFNESKHPSTCSLLSPALRSSSSVLCLKRSVRRGKQKYPSEKKKLERQFKSPTSVEIKDEGYWRFYKLGVPVEKDPGKDHVGVSDALLQAIAKVLEFPVASLLPQEAFSVVRKSFDARKVLKEAKFVYTVDMDTKKLLDLQPRAQDFVLQLEPKIGVMEHSPSKQDNCDLMSILNNHKRTPDNGLFGNGNSGAHSQHSLKLLAEKRPKVAVIGSGPSGLFASLVLGELGADVTLIERGQGVEQRGRDIGALVVRRILQPESNFCFGEGGAGTWSDGKLVTRIGRNSDSVQAVMKTFVQFGAPPNILTDGKPHLGTDKLVPLVRNFRQHLQSLGVDIMFGTRLDNLLVENSRVVGVEVSDVASGAPRKKLEYDAVILAVGHSARDVYQMLLQHNVELKPKDFSIGLRIEHPQELINNLQKFMEDVDGYRLRTTS